MRLHSDLFNVYLYIIKETFQLNGVVSLASFIKKIRNPYLITEIPNNNLMADISSLHKIKVLFFRKLG